jgi:hypothetical protein
VLLTVLAVQRTACGSRPHGKTLGGFGGAPFWVGQTPDAHRAYRETEGDAIRRQSGSIATYRCDHDRYTQNSRINASPEAGDSEQQPAQRKQQVAARVSLRIIPRQVRVLYARGEAAIVVPGWLLTATLSVHPSTDWLSITTSPTRVLAQTVVRWRGAQDRNRESETAELTR